MNKSLLWKAFINQELAIYAPSQEAYDELMQFFHDKRVNWIDGSDAADNRKINKGGIYIMGTREEDPANILVLAEKGESLLKDMAIVTTYYWLRYTRN